MLRVLTDLELDDVSGGWSTSSDGVTTSYSPGELSTASGPDLPPKVYGVPIRVDAATYDEMKKGVPYAAIAN
ncbi:hypothetical protein A0J51_00966 [Gluconobacter japonicus]|nr:hypothetical protein A0J51_00966 [Gluconobacter japonicus]